MVNLITGRVIVVEPASEAASIEEQHWLRIGKRICCEAATTDSGWGTSWDAFGRSVMIGGA